MSRKDDLRRQIDLYNRRLQKLEEQRAIKGISADPSLEIEIEDIETQIKKLQSDLQTLSTSGSEDVFHPFNADNTKEFSTNNPLSFSSIASGIIVTVIGGLILAYILQDARFVQFLGSSASSTPTLVPEPIAPPSTPTPISTPPSTRKSTAGMATPTPPPTPTPTHTPSPTLTWTPTTTPIPFPDLEWVVIPGGRFVMGSSDANIKAAVTDCNAYEGNCQSNWFEAEGPQREETIGDFEITKYEITNAQYNLCVKDGPCSPPRKVSTDNSVAYNASFFLDNYPVVTVTAADAIIFCQWVGGHLPNEWEWEKAARGADGRRYPWGNTLDMSRANLYSSGPTTVGSYPNGASPYGVMDIAGNVAEFTTDNVVRGGSWKNYPHHGRTTNRATGSWLTRDFTNFDIGFRCVR